MSAGVEGLREVPGPGAIGGGWRRFWHLLVLISVSDFRKSYFGTALGYLWSLIRPLLLFGVLLAVFTQIFRIGSDIPNYPVFLLLNIVLFTFFQEATSIAATSLVAQEGVIRKTQFPRLVIPLAAVVTGFLNLCMNLIAVTIFILVFGIEPRLTWLLLPVVVVALGVFATSVAVLLAGLYVRYRDVRIIWGVLTTVLFYGSAVLYPIEIVPDGVLRDALFFNPLVTLFVELRVLVVDPGAPTAIDAAGGAVHLIPAGLIFVGVAVLGFWLFARIAPRIAEDL